MNDEKWLDVVEKIKERFEILDREKMDLDEGGTEEAIIFESPLGKMKIVRTIRPFYVDKRNLGGRHVEIESLDGSSIDTDKMKQQIDVFKWDDLADDWAKAQIEL
jgi:hypothetical protein